MLVGTVTVKPLGAIMWDSATGQTVQYNKLVYSVEAVDSSNILYGRIKSSVYDAIQFMAGSTDECDELWERRFNVNLSSVKVEQGQTRNSEGKLIKYGVNHDFFCKLGAIIRYAKHGCRKECAVGYTGLNSASGEYTPETETTYVIHADAPFNFSGDDTLGTIRLRLGEIMAMRIETDELIIELEDDRGRELDIFAEIKNVSAKGFKFTSDYLGFHVNTFVPVKAGVNGMYTSLEQIIANNPDKDYAWLLGKEYYIVDDDMLDDVVKMFKDVPAEELIYFDTETTGLNINFLSRIGQADQCVGIILSYKDGESYFFPMQMKSIPNLCNGDHFYFMEHYMREILENKQLVAHNMSFDWKVAYIYDINANIVHDTMALFNLTLGQEKEGFSGKLKELAKLFLNRDSLELVDLVETDTWGENDVRFWDLPYELVRLYACADTDNTRGLMQYAIQNDLLHRYNATKVYEIEIAFSYAVAYQEFYGHKINTDQLAVLHKDIDRGIKENYDKMVELVGYEFNPNSSKQLVDIMYRQLGIPEQINRKTGRPTTDKETLKALAETTDLEGNPIYPFAVYLQEYRTYEGVRKIVDQFPEQATPDGYIFSAVQQYGTRTGRVSIKSPNYQSYNNPVKKHIVPRPGYYMTDTDYSSIEYRVLGNMANNTMIKEGFVDPDFDYHAYQAARMYGVPYAAVTSKLRKAAKGINFGLPYGMGDESLGIRVFGEKSVENTKKAAALRTKYFEGQEDIKDFFENARSGGVANGYTETFFGRRRYYHRNKYSVPAIRRQAGNAVIQGSAADIYKLAVGRLFLRICKEGWLGKVLLTGFIHDEVLCEVHCSIDPMRWLKVLREEFEVKIEGWCPLYMGFGFGMSWYEAKSTEIPIQLQWELVEKYGETGYPKWTGDGYALCAEVPDMIRDFSIRHVISNLTAEESQNKEIKVAINKSMLEVLADDTKYYNNYFAKLIESGVLIVDENNEATISADRLIEYKEELSKNHITGVVVCENGNVLVQLPKIKETQKAIDVFCMLHDVDRGSINVLNIEDTVVSAEAPASGLSVSVDYDEEDSDVRSEQEIMDKRVDTFGLYLDTTNSIIVLKLVPDRFMAFIKAHSNNNQGYRIRFKDSENKMFYDTQCYIASDEVQAIQAMYIQYFKTLAS